MFDYRLVNGEKVEKEDLMITAANLINGEVEVKCVLKY
jgi:hypothetical protein